MMKKSLYLDLIVMSGLYIWNQQTILKSLMVLLYSLYNIDKIKKFKKFDGALLGIILSVGVYYLMSLIDNSVKTIVNDQLLIMPATAYLLGKFIGHKSSNGFDILLATIIIGISLPVQTIYYIINDYKVMEGVARNIDIGAEEKISATRAAGIFVLIASHTGLVFLANKAVNYSKSLIIIFLCISVGVLSIYISTILGSRTLIGICGISLAVGLIAYARHNLSRNFIFMVLVFFAILILIVVPNTNSEMFSKMAEREVEGIDTASFGGRTERWANSVLLIIEYPFGWDYNLNGYSHNLWLDSARNGGWPSIIMFIILTVMFSASVKSSLASKKCGINEYAWISCITVGYFCLFSVEPILEGHEYVFASFCSFWGILNGYFGEKRNIKEVKKNQPYTIKNNKSTNEIRLPAGINR